MNYYFQRTRDNVSRMKLYSYTLLIIGLVSMVFYCLGDTPKFHARAKLIMGISFGICAIVSLIDVLQEVKTKKACNVYDLIRAIVSCFLCIMSFTCIDMILG